VFVDAIGFLLGFEGMTLTMALRSGLGQCAVASQVDAASLRVSVRWTDAGQPVALAHQTPSRDTSHLDPDPIDFPTADKARVRTTWGKSIIVRILRDTKITSSQSWGREAVPLQCPDIVQ
jgi:hypothetical protein